MTTHADYSRNAAFDLLNPEGDWLLLLLHGLGGDRQQALGLVGGLEDPGLAVLAPDLRAHGETGIIGGEDDFTFNALVGDILALVERLGQGTKPAIVAGVSMGAALALRLALAGNLDVRGLALVRPAFDDTPLPPNLAVMPVLAQLLRRDDLKEARERLVASPEYRAIADVTRSGAFSVEEQLTKPLARERAIRLEAVPRNVAWRDLPELRRVDVPSLVIGAERDAMHPFALARRLCASLPGGVLVEVTPRDIDPDAYQGEIQRAVRGHVAAVRATH